MKISNCYISYPTQNFKLEVESLTLKPHAINFLVGDNGSGKSTLFKQLILDNCMMPKQSKIMMLQKPYIFSGSVLENIMTTKQAFNSTINVDQLLERLDLVGLKNNNAKQLSGGQRQRLAFAMTIASQCQLILLDEPFNNIDVNTFELMIKVIEEQSAISTFFIISHQIKIAKRLGAHFVFLKDGKVNFEGDKKDFFLHHHDYLEKLMEME